MYVQCTNLREHALEGSVSDGGSREARGEGGFGGSALIPIIGRRYRGEETRNKAIITLLTTRGPHIRRLVGEWKAGCMTV